MMRVYMFTGAACFCVKKRFLSSPCFLLRCLLTHFPVSLVENSIAGAPFFFAKSGALGQSPFTLVVCSFSFLTAALPVSSGTLAPTPMWTNFGLSVQLKRVLHSKEVLLPPADCSLFRDFHVIFYVFRFFFFEQGYPALFLSSFFFTKCTSSKLYELARHFFLSIFLRVSQYDLLCHTSMILPELVQERRKREKGYLIWIVALLFSRDSCYRKISFSTRSVAKLNT